jgi:hypothetical protein
MDAAFYSQWLLLAVLPLESSFCLFYKLLPGG